MIIRVASVATGVGLETRLAVSASAEGLGIADSVL